MIIKTFFYFALIISTFPLFACNEWGPPKKIGALDPEINESSGIAISRKFPNRSYHINDSSSAPVFYQSDLTGKNLKKFSLKGTSAIDTEEIGYGKCPIIGECLVIGDIGDNRAIRDSIELVFVKEVENFGSLVTPNLILNIKYPDGPKNAEAMNLASNGDLIIITKELEGDVPRPKVYFISAEKIGYLLGKSLLQNAPVRADLVLEYMGSLNIPYLSQIFPKNRRFITSMSFSADGSSLIILTYENAIYFKWEDFQDAMANNNKGDEGIEDQLNARYQVVPLQILEQQESISFSGLHSKPEFEWFIYTTEVPSRQKSIGEVSSKRDSSPIIKVECLN